MLTLIEDLPEGVVGVEAHGKVTSEEYEQVLVPAVEAPGEINVFRSDELASAREWVASILPGQERMY